ncbi:unnamed protein product [Ixodes hexagonus]
MWDSQKRSVDQDPDYESIPLHAQQKRIKLHEQDAKEATVRKIEQIVKSRFSEEISTRESELDTINPRIYQAQVLLEKLRVGIITKYYAASGQPTSNEPGSAENQQTAQVHPTSKKYLGKSLPPSDIGNAVISAPSNAEGAKAASLLADQVQPASNGSREEEEENTTIGQTSRLKNKMRVIVGNVSKYISSEKRDPTDHATHKWMVYVRCPPGEPEIASVVRKVRFFLHPSYRPNDLVEVTEAPFQLVRKGWGEFPLRVQLHFRERWNKPVDVIHSLRLDKTYTGLQTLGAETVVDLWLCPMNGRQPEEVQERSLGSADNCERSHETETLPHTATEEVCAVQCLGKSQDSSEDFQPQQVSLGDSQPVQDVASAMEEEKKEQSQQQQNRQEEQESAETRTDTAVLEVTSQEPFPGQPIEPSSPAPAQNTAVPVRNALVANGTPKTSKPTLQSVMSANGVAAQSFVKCTDSLGRVLLIPTRSLLRPVAAVAPQPIASSAPVTVKAPSVLKSGASVAAPKLVPQMAGTAITSLPPNVVPTVTGAGIVAGLAPKAAPKVSGTATVRLAPSTSGTAVTRVAPKVVATVSGVGAVTGIVPKLASTLPGSTTTIGLALNVAHSVTRTATMEVTPSVAGAATVRAAPKVVTTLTGAGVTLGVASAGPPTYTLLVLPGVTSAQNQILLVPSSSLLPKEPVAVPCGVQQARQEVPQKVLLEVPRTATVKVELPTLPREDPDMVNAAKALQEKLDSLRLNKFPDLKQAIFAVASVFPLTGVTNAEKMACFPYAALDSDTYFSWPEPKQRASEWLRASEVRKTLKALIEKQEPSWYQPHQFLSRRKVMVLCRRFGFTPLHPDGDCQANNMQFLRSTCSSYSEPRELVSSLATLEAAPRPSVEEELIDIEECDQPSVAKKEHCPLKHGTTPRTHLPLSPGANYIREAASEVGVYLAAAEAGADAPVVEELIVSACKKFATCILRSAVNMAFERTGSERNIASVNVEDVYNGILDLKECDFLTNEGLGIEPTRETIVDSSHL